MSGLRNVKDKIREKYKEEARTKKVIQITQENLNEPLQQFYNSLSEKKTYYKSSFDTCYHTYTDSDKKLVIHIPMLAMELMEEYKMDLKAELAEHFNNEDFRLFLEEIPEVETGVKIQSKREIFDELAGKNQHLLTLRDKFGFDIIP